MMLTMAKFLLTLNTGHKYMENMQGAVLTFSYVSLQLVVVGRILIAVNLLFLFLVRKSGPDIIGLHRVNG